MNKCILFSLELARAEAANNKMEKKKNLKQMVKSNKKTRRRGQTEPERQTCRMEDMERERER